MHTAQRGLVGGDRVQTLRVWRVLPVRRRGRAPMHPEPLRHEPPHMQSTPGDDDAR